MKVKSKDGTEIAYVKTGQGPAVIIVEGALGTKSDSSALAERLAPRMTVFAYDRRGRGESGDTVPYAVSREVEDIDALIKEAGGSASLYGMSSGAVLALTAAAQGLNVAKLALFEPPFIVDASRAAIAPDYVSHLDELVSSGRRGEALEYFMKEAVGIPEPVIAQMRGTPMWTGMENVAHTLAYDGRIMGDSMAGKSLRAEQWGRVTIPTLVMDGGASEEWAHKAVQGLVDALPNATRRTLPGQSHAVDPAVLAPVLLEFFLG